MQAAHIGSIWLWAAVYVVAAALMIVGQPKPQDAGRRLRPWPSRHKRVADGGAVMKRMFHPVGSAVPLFWSR
jgi:hypothetical protein